MADDKKIIFSMVGVSKTFPPQKQVLKNIYLSFFYVFLFYLVFTVVGIKEFTWSGLISCFFPIRNDFYWFISAYFVLILASPFLTLTIRSLGGKKLLALILVFGLIWSVIPTITTRTEYYGSSLLWFMLVWGYLFLVFSWV